MNVVDIQKIILHKTFTKADYIRRVQILKGYLESKFFKGNIGAFQEYLTKTGASIHDREAMGTLDEHFFNLFTRDNFYAIVNQLAEGIKTLPVLTLYLAIVTDVALLDQLGIWFRRNLHPELIIELHCNPNLLAGAAYVWNNKYYDISLRTFFRKKEDLITQIVDSYAKSQL